MDTEAAVPPAVITMKDETLIKNISLFVILQLTYTFTTICVNNANCNHFDRNYSVT